MKFTVQPFIVNDDLLGLETTIEMDGFEKQVTRQVCDLKDQAVREALIKLGWTPPPDDQLSTNKPNK